MIRFLKALFFQHRRDAERLSFGFLFAVVLSVFGTFNAVAAQASSIPTVTLIIDDLGYNWRNGLRAVDLPGAISYAVLPHTPFSKRLAKKAHEKGKTVMLHAPMTNVHQRSPGPGALSPDMDRESFEQELRKALDAIPHVQGVNNHMGSELTQDATRMQWLMDEVSKRRLFFIDSRTTSKSVAVETARANGIPSLSRDIFLDHIRTPEAVNQSFDALIKRAKRKGHAVAIGHPDPVTLEVLERRLPELKAQGIRLISVAERLVAMGQAYDETLPAYHGTHEQPLLMQVKAGDVTHPKIVRKSVIVRKNDLADDQKRLPDLGVQSEFPQVQGGVDQSVRSNQFLQPLQVPKELIPEHRQDWMIPVSK